LVSDLMDIELSRHAHRRRQKLLQPGKELSFRKVTLYNIIIFVTNVSESICCAMLDAGALSLVIVASVNADFLPSKIMVPRRERIPGRDVPGMP
jgi:hypothetical protein